MINVTLYFHSRDDDFTRVLSLLEDLRSEFPHQLALVDTSIEPALWAGIKDELPVLDIGPYRLKKNVSKTDLQVALAAATDRLQQRQNVDDVKFTRKLENGRTFTGTDRFSLWFSAHYMALFNFLVFVYVGLPFLAPTFMYMNMPVPAKVIYTIYSPLCHQFSFRSWFLYGKQAFYPRELAHIPGMVTYESLINSEVIDILDARNFIGNIELGYKTAFCQRDIAIYGAILLFGLIFSISRTRFKPLPWYVWILVGLVPIGIDGVSQIPGLAANFLPDWIPLRESTPWLRSLTGGLFGLTTAWYIYPLIEEAMQDTRRMLLKKQSISTVKGF